MEPSTQSSSSPAIPIAIICGFAMIAIAIFFTNKNKVVEVPVATQTATNQASTTGPLPVTEADYIKGNPNAPILMVEYSDYDCSFCKQYQATMNQIMDEYGVTGKVAWVYRQFPLADLHPNAPRISEAALCVGDIGGNDAFWKFTDLVYNSRNLDDMTNVTKLPDFAEQAGVSKGDFLACLNSNKLQQAVLDSAADAFNSGARGAPYTILMVGDQQAVISGAQPYDTVKGIVQNLIDQLDGTFDDSAVKAADIPTDSRGVPVLE